VALLFSTRVLPGPDELCRRLLGASPDGAQPFFVWDDRATYRVRIGTEEFVVKADANEGELAGEAEGHAHAAAHGIPVPELVAVETNALAMRFVHGEQLGARSPDAAWLAAAAIVEQIHNAPPIGPAGRFPRPIDVLIEGATRNGLDRATADRIHKRLLAAPATTETTWVHGDLQRDHFIMNGNDVAAVLDWSDHGRADPLWDYTVLTFDDPPKLALMFDEPPDPEHIARLRTRRLLDDVRWLAEHDMHDAAQRARAELNAQ
jgi:aminoglycoside phosphotransferase (APT) family kinase protein